jgi:diadenosine tetraphosphatase ApaH/serine/threonine PP2A family protein phosphatase
VLDSGQALGDRVILALLSDLHANFEALDACLKHARMSGAGRYAFLGDLVGYGADPRAVVDLVRRYAAEGAVVVQGNHDAAVAGTADGMNDEARQCVIWTRSALDAESQAWLAALPLSVRDGEICFVHASAAEPRAWEYVEHAGAAEKSVRASGATWTFSGHVHKQTLWFGSDRMSAFRPTPGIDIPVGRNRKWLAIAGSVGQPRERNSAAAYALFDLKRHTLAFHRVPYDHLAAARKIRAAGLPALIPWRSP